MITRRYFSTSTAVIAANIAGPQAVAAAAEDTDRYTFVLVHGAWHGGWCWRYVRNWLQDQGHRVFTPTLTGHGERIHLRNSEVDLNTHIQDIINVIEWEELKRIILVGHSYGGMIISGVCDALRSRIAHAIYLDAAAPKDGDQVVNGRTLEDIRRIFGPLKDGFLARAPTTTFGIPSDMNEEIEWVQRRLTPQTTGTWLQKISLPNGGSDGLPRTFIFCNDQSPATGRQAARIHKFKSDPTWAYEELPCGHDSMIILPEQTARMFEKIASTT